MIKEKECREAFNVLQEQHDYLSSNMHYNYPFSIEMLEKVQYCFEKLITEHFEHERYKSIDEFVKSTEQFYVNDTYFGHIVRAISKCDDKEMQEYAIHCLTYLKQQLSRYENPQPYKFEDLKEGMWVYDKKNKDMIQCFPYVTNHNVQCIKYDSWIDESGDYIESYEGFEEGRFFPVSYANLEEFS